MLPSRLHALYLSLLSLTFLTSEPLTAQPALSTIADARTQVGDTVRVRGIVTFAGLRPIYLQDATAGIAAYSTSGLTDASQVGDSIEITGVPKNYNNLLELDTVISVATLGAGLPVPDPIVLPLTSAGESYEARLLRFDGVSFVQSGNFSGNTNYTITNGVNSLQVRIPNGSPLVGSFIPAGTISIIGVLGQFFSSYQLFPRTAADFIALPGPTITAGPEVDSVFANGFRVRWTTQDPGSSTILFGPGDSIVDSLGSATLTRDHGVTISGLSSGIVYGFVARSVNSNGTSAAARAYSVTTSPASTGEIGVYFNYAVDASLPLTEQANGGVNLGSLILQRIDASAKSIDLALYSFNDATSAPDIAQTVAQALVTAKNRGVSIRVVFDDRTTTTPLQTLIDAGIPVVKRNVPGGIMHNKFWVFDGRDTSDATDDWVVTGSWNMTDVGTYSDAQNAVFLQDQSLAAIYTREFNEMFGSSGTNPGASRFGSAKLDDTPHFTYVGGKKVEVRFSPSDATTSAIVRAMESADQNIFFGLLTFTRDDIADAIIQRKNSGVIVKGIMNDDSDQGTEYPTLVGAGVDVRLESHAVVSGQFHHKYAIIDPFDDARDPTVITGSHNWSTAAETNNDENTLVIHSGSIARQYVREFSKRYSESGGTGQVVGVRGFGVRVPGSYTLSAAYPNPFNPATHLIISLPKTLSVDISVFDLLGRRVDRIGSGMFEAGTYSFTWNPTVSSGTYVIVSRTDLGVLARRVVLVR